MSDDALAAEARADAGPGTVQAMLARACGSEKDGPRFALLLQEALPSAERLGAGALRELAPLLKHVNGLFARADVPIGYRERVDRRLRALLASVDEAYLPEGVLPVHDAWAAPLRERVRDAPSPDLTRFVRHLASLSAPRPTRAWHRACVALAGEAAAREEVAECLRVLAEDEPHCPREDGPHTGFSCGYHHLVHPHHGDVARGLVWAAALTGGPEAVPRLQAVALRMGTSGRDLYEGPKVAGAAINALGAVDDPSALEALWRLRTPVTNRGLRKQLDTALQAAAERQGITRAQLVERTVPAHGLGPDGSVERVLGDHTARVAVEGAAAVRITFTGPGGRTSRTAPAAVKDGFPDELRRSKALAKEVRATLSSERARVEGLMSEDRVWPYAEWREFYRDHPITGAVVRGLIWEFQGEDGLWRASLADPGGAAHVRLWHPIRAGVDEVRAWRERVVEEQVRQPFKQAFREIYLLTPAEEGTAAYSNRYAAHIVHYRRLYALFKERRWQANFLGRHEGGHHGEARGEFGGGEWRACFHHEPAGDDGDWAIEHAATDQVRFERRHGGRWREAPLADVPPPVFSEAMRDVDLFVGVTSIAADPDWADRGEDRRAAYWREAGFGALTASAEVRRAALERILPRTKIADRCALDGRHLVVRGELRTYRIHLGSANVLMEPDGAYLCVVQGRRAPGTLYLPFEDERLSLILSKALLLAADDKITDASIRRQIGRVIT